MRVLITGASGFIASHVIENLKEKGHEVIGLDHHNHGFETFCGDVRDATIVDEAVSRVDGVIHLAAVLGTQETINNPLPSVETNIIGSLNVFQACKAHNKKCVYIAVGNHWMDNPYSITKTTAERFALMFNKEFGTKIAVVRGLNAYGPGQKAKPVRKVIPNFIIPALRDEEIIIYGDGSQVMDFIYVKDIAEVLVRALTEEHGVYDKIFDAGSGNQTTIKEVADTVIRLVGKGKLKYVPMRPGEPEHSVVVGNPKTLLPLGIYKNRFTSLEEGLAETIKYYEKAESLN
jgi:nucleoside-diphosphate-sugar epimerase